MVGSGYESDLLLAQYLLLHYGSRQDIGAPAFVPDDALEFPARCVELFDWGSLPESPRGLDVGCAVGRAAFEMARRCREVVGIDLSHQFIESAQRLAIEGVAQFDCPVEGRLRVRVAFEVPREIDRARVRFEVGSALDLPSNLGTFDAVLMANLLCRLDDPRRCLQSMPVLVRAGGVLVIASPYSWLAEFTPETNWLGGRNGPTLEALRRDLEPAFELEGRLDLPFLIREHARKFQLGLSEATVWRRRR